MKELREWWSLSFVTTVNKSYTSPLVGYGTHTYLMWDAYIHANHACSHYPRSTKKSNQYLIHCQNKDSLSYLMFIWVTSIMVTIESIMVNESIACGKTMWSPTLFSESYNGDFTIESMPKELPSKLYIGQHESSNPINFHQYGYAIQYNIIWWLLLQPHLPTHFLRSMLTKILPLV